MLSIKHGFQVVVSLAGNPNMKDQLGMIDDAATRAATNFQPSECGAGPCVRTPEKIRYVHDKHLTRQHLANTEKALPLISVFRKVCSRLGEDVRKETLRSYQDALNEAPRLIQGPLLGKPMPAEYYRHRFKSRLNYNCALLTSNMSKLRILVPVKRVIDYAVSVLLCLNQIN